MKRFRTRSPEQTFALGRSFARSLRPGDIVGLIGNLGSGKTRFIAGVCEGLGAGGHFGSPTFTLIHEYSAPFGCVVHIDLYRIAARSEIADLGLEEYFNERNVCLIEWAERAEGLLPAGHQTVMLEYGEGDQDRVITLPAPMEEEP